MMSGTTSRLKHRLAVLIIKPSLLISQDLLLSLIKKDPVDRLSAGEALKHSWFQEDEEACKVARDIMLNTEDSVRVTNNCPLGPVPMNQIIMNGTRYFLSIFPNM